ncbi:MAG: hypothetical protein ABI383_04445 [Acidobacteriaceae bacterium]
MKNLQNGLKNSVDRRTFVKNGLTAAGGVAIGAGLLAHSTSALAQEEHEERSGHLSKGDAAILRFLAAAEILETDLWQQYNELGGIQDSQVPGGVGAQPIPPHSRSWMRTWHSISTTIRKMS